jgi:ArsR family transcriptional regulator
MILNILRSQELSVAKIAKLLEIPLGTVSPHLLMMKRRRVLVSRRDGIQIFYRIANPKILSAFDLIQKILCEHMEKEARLVREATQK